MSDGKDMEQPLVFGLDIGTRNVAQRKANVTKSTISIN